MSSARRYRGRIRNLEGTESGTIRTVFRAHLGLARVIVRRNAFMPSAILGDQIAARRFARVVIFTARFETSVLQQVRPIIITSITDKTKQCRTFSAAMPACDSHASMQFHAALHCSIGPSKAHALMGGKSAGKRVSKQRSMHAWHLRGSPPQSAAPPHTRLASNSFRLRAVKSAAGIPSAPPPAARMTPVPKLGHGALHWSEHSLTQCASAAFTSSRFMQPGIRAHM